MTLNLGSEIWDRRPARVLLWIHTRRYASTIIIIIIIRVQFQGLAFLHSKDRRAIDYLSMPRIRWYNTARAV